MLADGIALIGEGRVMLDDPFICGARANRVGWDFLWMKSGFWIVFLRPTTNVATRHNLNPKYTLHSNPTGAK